MQINHSLMIFKNLLDIIEKNDLPTKFQFLIDTYNKAGSKPFNNITKSKIDETINLINEAKQDLIAIFWYLPLHDFFKKNDVNNIIHLKLFDSSTIRVEKHLDFINQLIESCNSIKIVQETSQHVIKEFEQISIHEYNGVNKNEAIKTIRIYFVESTSINSLEELDKYNRIWNNILIAFRKLTRDEENPILVQFVDKYSLILNTSIKTTTAIVKAMSEILNTHKRLLEIKNLKQEIHNVELSNEVEFEKLLEEESANIIDEHSANLTRELMENNEWEYLQNQKLFDSIQIALKQILTFIEKGGKIDIKQNSQNDELNDMNKNIINNFIIISDLK
jgi:hypothetical protein